MYIFQLISPQLHIKSRKAPAPEGFVTHASKLENLNNGPFLIHWVNGKITAIYLDQQEEISLSNLKKGISSLFQVNATIVLLWITAMSSNVMLKFNNICVKSVNYFAWQNQRKSVASKTPQWGFDDKGYL